jgi:replication-associated recombination protein RarA
MAPRGRQSVAELLRPRQLGDLTLPRRDIERLEQSSLNMLFYGQPGVGKTSAARILAQPLVRLDAKAALEIRASGATDKEFERRAIPDIVGFVFGRRHADRSNTLCFIDDADHIPKRAQAMMQFDIDHQSGTKCRFIFAVNDISKIIDPLRSRLQLICFDPAAANRAEIKERLFRRYVAVLSSREGIHFEKKEEKRLIELIGLHFPDLRAIANQVQYELIDPLAAQSEEEEVHAGGGDDAVTDGVAHMDRCIGPSFRISADEQEAHEQAATHADDDDHDDADDETVT